MTLGQYHSPTQGGEKLFIMKVALFLISIVAGCSASGIGLINPNSLPVPLDEVHTAALKTAQIIQQNSEGTRNILGGGVPLNLPADTHEVAIGKQAHAIADLRQKAIINSVRLATPRIAAVAAPAVAAVPALAASIGVAAPWASAAVAAPWNAAAVAAPWNAAAVAAPWNSAAVATPWASGVVGAPLGIAAGVRGHW